MEEEIKKAKEKAMSLLLIKDRTEKELSERLYHSGFSEVACEEAMEYVKSFGYIDDFRYAKNFIDFRKNEKSKKEIQFKLLQKGVCLELIAVAMEEEYDGETEALQRALKKRLKGKSISDLTLQEKQKLIASLARKGFSLSEILRQV